MINSVIQTDDGYLRIRSVCDDTLFELASEDCYRVYVYKCNERGIIMNFVPLEISKPYSNSENELKIGREIYERYRVKNDKDNEDGKVVKMLRELGWDAHRMVGFCLSFNLHEIAVYIHDEDCYSENPDTVISRFCLSDFSETTSAEDKANSIHKYLCKKRELMFDRMKEGRG